MKILVCIKSVFDSEAEITVSDNKVTASEQELVINPFDEYAVEAAIQLKESVDAEVTVMTVGNGEQTEALRHALAMGADSAIVSEVESAGLLDTRSTSRVIAGFIKEHPGFDLIIFGRQTIEYGSGLVPSQVARLLDLPYIGLVGKIETEDGFMVERVLDDSVLRVTTDLPAVISVVQSIGEPRFPSFMGIRKAKKAEIPTWKPANLVLPLTRVGSISKTSADSGRSACVFISGDDPKKVSEELVKKIIEGKHI